MPHYVVTHWYHMWCKMWMWIHLWYYALELNGWMNLLTLWSQLTSQLHAFQYILDYMNFWFCSCDWSINAPTTFYNSTCLAIFALIWKGTKGQSMIACLYSSQNAHTLESNLATSKSIDSWSLVSIWYLVWSNSGFPWCEYDCGTSSNTFTCAFTYLDDFR